MLLAGPCYFANTHHTTLGGMLLILTPSLPINSAINFAMLTTLYNPNLNDL